MHDKTGAQLSSEFEKPFKQAHKINQSMLRPEFSREGLDAPQAPEFHEPPGTRNIRTARGRVGPKYESWSGCACSHRGRLLRLRIVPSWTTSQAIVCPG